MPANENARPAEPRDVRLKRLKFRSEHRGIKEMDIVLSQFAATVLPTLDAHGLDEYETVLDIPDQDLLAWKLGTQSPPSEFDENAVLRQVLEFQVELPR